MDEEFKPLDRSIVLNCPDGLRRALAERDNWIARLGKEAINKSNAKLRSFALERRAIIDGIQNSLASVLTDRDTMFISFSGSDNPYFSCAKRIAETTYGFKVTTGPTERDDENQLHLSIRKTIAASSAFLGIWTEEYTAQSVRDRSEGGVPSAWLPFELGVATAHDLPFRLCLHRDIHKDFREKIESNRVHQIFDGNSYEEILEKCIGELRARIMEQRLRRLAEVDAAL
jgi:hypothetical protein